MSLQEKQGAVLALNSEAVAGTVCPGRREPKSTGHSTLLLKRTHLTSNALCRSSGLRTLESAVVILVISKLVGAYSSVTAIREKAEQLEG